LSVEFLLARWFKAGYSGVSAHSGEDGALLVREVAAGKPEALEELYRRHSRELFVYIFGRLGDRQLAEETLQDVMLAVWRGAGRFRGESSARTWLFAIAYRRAMSASRRLPEKPAPEWAVDDLKSEAQGPAEWTDERERVAAVRSALHRLPDHQRSVIELVFLHGLSGREAARVLGVPVGTVKSRQNRALKALAPLLAEVAQ